MKGSGVAPGAGRQEASGEAGLFIVGWRPEGAVYGFPFTVYGKRCGAVVV